MNATNQTKEQYECHHDGKTNVSTLYEELETMYRWMIFSQVRQDSILETIFSYIGTTNKFCVEFGVDNNANLGGNTLLLAKKGWNSLLLDGNQDSAHMNLHKEWISRLTINSIFDKYNVPENPDYVSIDIDSCDLWVFLAITNRYHPRVITVEYNANFMVGRDGPMTVNCMRNDSSDFQWTGNRVWGVSLQALYMAGKIRGYTLIAVENKTDAFFIRDDLLLGTAPELDVFQKYTGYKMHTQENSKLKRAKWEINFAEWLKLHSVDEVIKV